MTVKKRVGRPRAQPGNEAESARDAILRAARTLFRQQGVKTTTTRQIADAAGLRQPTIFHYFANKLEIVREIASQAMAPELEFIEAEKARAADPPERLYRYTHFVVTNLVSNPSVIGSPLQFPELTPEAFTEFFADYERIFAALEDILRAGMEAGVFLDLPLEVTARQLFALIEAGLQDERLDPAAAQLVADNAALLVLRSVLVDQELLTAFRESADR